MAGAYNPRGCYARKSEEPVKIPAVALGLLLLSTVGLNAQLAMVTIKPLTDDDIKLIRQDIQSAKDGIIKDTMQFSEAEGAAFWPIYKEYSAEQRGISEKRFAVISDYSKHFDTMTDADAGGLTERM